MPTTRTPFLRSKRSALALACGVGLACGGAAQAQSSADVLTQWREYARRGVVPEYSWSGEDTPRSAPTLFDGLALDDNVLRSASFAAVGFSGRRLDVGFGDTAAGSGNVGVASPRAGAYIDFDGPRSAIRSEFVASTYEQALGPQGGRVGVTAIVARQRYATAGLGAAPWGASDDVVGVRDISGAAARQETAMGHGVRVGYLAPLGDDVAWSLSAQSKLEMDEFRSFRGMYSEAGDFDVPGRLEARLSWSPLSFAALSLGVDRVFYSDIDTFTSAALPRRFLSLLGDGGAPQFAWQDLTVYSIEGTLADRWDGRWTLRYSSSQQPEPTSALLALALDVNDASNNLLLGYRRGIVGVGELAFNASYSSDAYFLGATPYALRNFDRGSQVELEAIFSVPF